MANFKEYTMNIIHKGIEYSPAQIREMRYWLSELQWLEDNFNINDYSDLFILKKTDKEYEGGLTAFIQAINI